MGWWWTILTDTVSAWNAKCVREENLLKKITFEIARDLGKNA